LSYQTGGKVQWEGLGGKKVGWGVVGRKSWGGFEKKSSWWVFKQGRVEPKIMRSKFFGGGGRRKPSGGNQQDEDFPKATPPWLAATNCQEGQKKIKKKPKPQTAIREAEKRTRGKKYGGRAWCLKRRKDWKRVRMKGDSGQREGEDEEGY